MRSKLFKQVQFKYLIQKDFHNIYIDGLQLFQQIKFLLLNPSYQFYMIKFILERYANAENEEEEDQNGPKNSKTPEINQSTVALKNLKQTQDHIDALKRRLSVLAIRDQKNQNKAKSNERKLEFHAKVQEEIARDRKRKMRYLQHFQNQLEQSKEKIQQFNNRRSTRLKEVKEDLHDSRKNLCERIKKQSESHEKSIEKLKLEQLNSKVNRRKSINEMEKLQKEHIAEYFFSKKKNFRESSAREGSQYQSRQSERSKILEQLAARESQMIQRQSSSRAALDESTQKLYKFATALRPIKREKSTSDFSQKMPQLAKPHQQLVFL